MGESFKALKAKYFWGPTPHFNLRPAGTGNFRGRALKRKLDSPLQSKSTLMTVQCKSKRRNDNRKNILLLLQVNKEINIKSIASFGY